MTFRSVAAAMISAIWGWTVGSPPESISASTRPPSRSMAASSDRRMCGSRACRLIPGPLSAKQVGQWRLQFSVTSISRMQLCWVWRSPSPSM